MTRQIDIQVKIKKLPKGWVAMDKNEKWCWFEHKPIKHFGDINKWLRQNTDDNWDYLVNIKPVSDWTKSLIKVENRDECMGIIGVNVCV